jgi:hypothetical protein
MSGGDCRSTMIQGILDIIIFFARNMVAAFALFFAACMLARRWTVMARLRAWSAQAWGLSVALLAVFVGIAAWYVGLEGFAGEVEPAVSTLSWLVSHGHPLYTPFDAAERYSVLYGPSVFLTNGLFLRMLGPSLPAVKLASALGAVGSLLLLYAALARRRRDTLAVALTAGAAMYVWAQGFSVYAVRPDALMVFAVGLGLYGAARLRPLLALAVVAATAGFAVNLKLHGLLYFVPVVALLATRHGGRAAAGSLAGALAVAAMPFAFNEQISLTNYLAWVRNATQHGLNTEYLALDLGYAAALLLPLGLVLGLGGWRRWRGTAEGTLLLSLGAVLPAVLVLASKPGAGLVHLMPLALPTIYVLGRLLQRLQDDGFDWRPRTRSSVAVAFGLTLVLAGTVNEYRAVRLLAWEVGQQPDLAKDVRAIMARYDGLTLAMACGGEAKSFRSTWPRPLLAFGDNPVLLDPISVMDSSLSGRELSPSTYRAISDGRIKVWLVPRGQEPFRKTNWYAPHTPIFPDAFVRHFETFYSPRAQTRYFDLWFWNGLPEVAASGIRAAVSVADEGLLAR